MAKVLGDMFDKIGIGKGPKGVSLPNLLGGAVKTVDVVSDRATVNAGTVIVKGGNQGSTPASVPGGWS